MVRSIECRARACAGPAGLESRYGSDEQQLSSTRQGLAHCAISIKLSISRCGVAQLQLVELVMGLLVGASIRLWLGEVEA